MRPTWRASPARAASRRSGWSRTGRIGSSSSPEPTTRSTAIRWPERVDIVIGQLEIPQAVTIAAFQAARTRGATTILNPAPAARLEADLIGSSSWLIPNETEFAILAGLHGFDPNDDAPIADYARRISPRLLLTL